MAVLVNYNSYSAAEFFAAALQEYDYAEIVGEQTYGKGRFQTAFRLPDGSAVNLSFGTYTTPNGVSLVGKGITPDYPVEMDEQTEKDLYYGNLAFEDDEQLKTAISVLTSGEGQ
jgi:carboxyl-terminal processing protease